LRGALDGALFDFGDFDELGRLNAGSRGGPLARQNRVAKQNPALENFKPKKKPNGGSPSTIG
jgi:hypothetical protein